MKKEKIKKEKKPRVSLKQRIINNISSKVQNAVLQHDNWLIDKICYRIEFLSLQENFSISLLISDLKNGGYNND